MSLLHDALKKAEGEKSPHPPGASPPEGEEGGTLPTPSGGKRVYVLAGLVGVALLGAVYFRFFPNLFRSVPQTSAVKTARLPLGITGMEDKGILSQEADQLLAHGEWEKARQVLEKWVVVDPENPEIYNNLGVVSRKLGDRRKAYDRYRRALTLAESYPEALNNLGVLYMTDAKFPEAREYLEKATQIRPDYADPYFHLAMIFEAQGQLKEARQFYERFIELTQNKDAQFLLEIRNRVEGFGSS